MELTQITKCLLNNYVVLGAFNTSTLRANLSKGAAAPPTGPFPTVLPGMGPV